MMNVTTVPSIEDFLSLRKDWERIRSDHGEHNFYDGFEICAIKHETDTGTYSGCI